MVTILQILERDYSSPNDYSLSEAESDYDRIVWNIDSINAKPSLEDLEARVVAEEARLIEVARIEALTVRFRAIEDISLAKHLAGLDVYYPNNEILLKDIIDDNDEAKLESLEAKRAEANSFVNQKQINSEAEAYLKATDYYIIREVDSGIACPAEIKAERAAARLRIVN